MTKCLAITAAVVLYFVASHMAWQDCALYGIGC